MLHLPHNPDPDCNREPYRFGFSDLFLRFLLLAVAFVCLLGLFIIAFSSPAAQQVINTGSAANDHTGEGLRTAFGKVNSNFWELYTNAPLLNPHLTNGVNHGNAFSSPGSGGSSEQFGAGAASLGLSSIAIGPGMTTVGPSALGIGTVDNIASGTGSVSIASRAVATESYTLAVGYGSGALYAYSSAVGANSLTTATNQVRLGQSGSSVSMGNELDFDAGPKIFIGTTNSPTFTATAGSLYITTGAGTAGALWLHTNSTIAASWYAVKLN